MKKILVLAPRFPAINQPWIDTYLEQLLIHNLEPLIYSTNREGGPYQERVDRLNLRQYVVDFSLGKAIVARSLLACLICHPILFCKMLLRSFNVAKEFDQAAASKLGTMLKLLHFACAHELFVGVSAIHAHEEIAAYEFLHLAKLHRIPLIITFHGLPPKDVGQLSTEKRRLLYDFARVVLVNTEFSKSQVTALGCDPAKVVILPQGLPMEDYPYRAPVPRSESAPLEVLTVGRFHRDKGQGYALLALARLKARGLNIKWHFVGVGPDKQRLLGLIRRLQLEDVAVFHQALEADKLLALYQTCDIFVLPSIDNRHGRHVETQGVVLQEAQACGCVPVASSVGGIPECLHDGVDAILVRQKSSRAIASAVSQLFLNKAVMASYRENGRKNVEENFSAAMIGRKMAAIINSC